MLSEDQNQWLDALREQCDKQASVLADAVLARYENRQFVAALEAERETWARRLSQPGLSEGDELVHRGRVARCEEKLRLLVHYEINAEKCLTLP